MTDIPDDPLDFFRKTRTLLTNAGFDVEMANHCHPNGQALICLAPVPWAHAQITMNKLHLLMSSTLGEPGENTWSWTVNGIVLPFSSTVSIRLFNVDDRSLLTAQRMMKKGEG